MPWLSEKNTHAFDSLVRFEERDHKYFYTPTGEVVRKSMTAVLSPIFSHFDPLAVAKRYVPTWLKADGGDHPEKAHRYHHLCRARQLVEGETEEEVVNFMVSYWKSSGMDAAAEGTSVHRTLELFIQGELQPSPDEPLPPCVATYEDWKRSFYPNLEFEPWRTEFSMVLTTTVTTKSGLVATIPVLAGQIDLILRSKTTGKFVLIDWKNTHSRKGKIGRPNKRAFPPSAANSPFENFEATDFTKYSAQLEGYRYILLKMGYFEPGEIIGAFIVQVHSGLDRAHCIETADGLDESFDECVVKMMEAEELAAREEYDLA